jgi:hypothetical protein
MITTVEHAQQVLLQNLKPEARVTDGTQTAEPGIWSFSVTMFSQDRGKDDTYIFYVSSHGQVWCAKGSVEIWKKEALLKEALIEGCEVVYHSSLDGGNELFEVTYAGNTFYIVMDNEYMFRLFYGGTDSMLQPLLRPAETETGRRRPRRRQR